MWLLTLNNPNDRTGGAQAGRSTWTATPTPTRCRAPKSTVYVIDFLLKNYGTPRSHHRAASTGPPSTSSRWSIPDGRAMWFRGTVDAQASRAPSWMPVDDDRDGTQRRGRLRRPRRRRHHHADAQEGADGRGPLPAPSQGSADPRADRGRRARRLRHPGLEGIDNDGDGRVNEDTVGYVDPNRTWGYGWEPEYVQVGCRTLSPRIPETRSIATWALTTDNIAAAQSFHNNGRHDPAWTGRQGPPQVPGGQDVRGLRPDRRGGRANAPGLRVPARRGATSTRPTGPPTTTSTACTAPSPLPTSSTRRRRTSTVTTRARRRSSMDFNDLLTLGRQFVDFTEEVEHPQYGTVEVGRLPPRRGPRARGLDAGRGGAPQRRLRDVPRPPPAHALLRRDRR